MGNYEQLKQAVSDVIKTNGNQEITGAILQNALLTIISTVGGNANFAGVATPLTNPGTPDQNVFWIASQSGIYQNFNGIEIKNESAILINKNGNWEKENLGVSTTELIFVKGSVNLNGYAINGYVWDVNSGELVQNSDFKCTQKFKVEDNILLSFNNYVYRILLWKDSGFDVLSNVYKISIDCSIYKFFSINMESDDNIECVIHNNICYYEQSYNKSYNDYNENSEAQCIQNGYINYKGGITSNVPGVNRGVTDYIDIHNYDAVKLLGNTVHINVEHNIFGALYNSEKKFIKSLAYNFKGQDYSDVNADDIFIDCKYAYYIRLTVNDFNNKAIFKTIKTTDYNPVFKNIELKDISNDLFNNLSVGDYGYNINTKLLRKCIVQGSEFETIPFVPAAIYKYENRTYQYDGEDLVLVGGYTSTYPLFDEIIKELFVDKGTFDGDLYVNRFKFSSENKEIIIGIGSVNGTQYAQFWAQNIESLNDLPTIIKLNATTQSNNTYNVNAWIVIDKNKITNGINLSAVKAKIKDRGYTISDNPIINAKIGVFFAKKAVILGSSNTTNKWGTWSQDLCKNLGIKDLHIGVGGATFPLIDGYIIDSNLDAPSELIGMINSVVTQVDYLLTLDYTPDIIIINSGSNDASQQVLVGSIDKCNAILDANTIKTDEDIEKNIYCMCGAMRYCLMKLREKFKNALIVGVIPWQWGSYDNCNRYRTEYKQSMIEMYHLEGIPVINAFDNGGIFWNEEWNSENRVNTVDGIHVKVDSKINKRGRELQRNFITQNFINVFYSKKYNQEYIYI